VIPSLPFTLKYISSVVIHDENYPKNILIAGLPGSGKIIYGIIFTNDQK
jgi:hypothetical protein